MQDSFHRRWVAYFDLLGFKKLLEKYHYFPELVLTIYEDALSDLENSTDDYDVGLIDYCWFSDTFLLWSIDNTSEAFPSLEQTARLFFSRLILDKIPVRGAISYGLFYTDKHRNTYIGQALVDAYEYAEKQQWLNYVLTPSLCLDLPRIKLPNLLNYHPISTFMEDVYPGKNDTGKDIWAYTYSANDSLGKNIYEALGQLLKESCGETERVKNKYNNSLSWLKMQEKRFGKMREQLQ